MFNKYFGTTVSGLMVAGFVALSASAAQAAPISGAVNLASTLQSNVTQVVPVKFSRGGRGFRGGYGRGFRGGFGRGFRGNRFGSRGFRGNRFGSHRFRSRGFGFNTGLRHDRFYRNNGFNKFGPREEFFGSPLNR